MELYSFPEPEDIDAEENLVPHEAALVRQPIWSHSFSDGETVCCSQLYWDGTTYRLVISTDKGIWGLSCLASTKDTLSITQLSNFTNKSSVCAPGVRKAYAYCGKDVMGVRLGYAWENGKDSNSELTYTNGETKSAQLIGDCAAFDEQSGRFVYLTKRDITVVDFVSI